MIDILLWTVFAVVMGSVLLVAISVVIVATRENRIYSAEAKIWQQLQGKGVPIQAVVESLKRSEHGLTRGGSQGQTVCAVELDLRLSGADAQESPTRVRTLIDKALLPRFTEPGMPVHLLRDPDDLSVLAIDRSRTPLEIPRAEH